MQVIADPIGRLMWISPPLPGARHDMGAAREHGILDAVAAHEIPAVADTAYQTGRYRPLSAAQKDVNAAHARRRGRGERVNAELKNWRILRRSDPAPAELESSSPQFRPS